MRMQENLTAASVYNSDIRTPLTIYDKVAIGMGEETKALLHAHIGKHSIALLERTFDRDPRDPTVQPETVRRYIDTWKAFRAADMPVVPTLRLSSAGTVLATDIKADGSEVYGKGVLMSLCAGRKYRRIRPHRAIDPLFLQITSPSNLPTVAASVHEYRNRADTHSLGLANDDPFELLVHPDGSWDLICLDLTQAFVYRADDINRTRMDVLANNAMAAGLFLRLLQNLHTGLGPVAKHNPARRAA